MRRGLGIILMAGVVAWNMQAQDFRRVVEIVGEMETTLKQLISKEAQQRQTEIASLRTEMADLRSAVAQPAPEALRPAMDPLLARVESLERQVAAIGRNADLSLLGGQLTELAAELRKTITEAQVKAAAPPVPPPAFPSVKVGLLAQFHALAAQEQTSAGQDNDPSYTRHWQRQLYIRRLRVLVGGNLTANTTYFFESDATNIGKVAGAGAKSSTVSMYVQDAQLQHTFAPEISLIAGLQLVGITRNSLQSAASLMALNYGTYQFMTSGPLDNSVGRDIGLSARGFLFDERFEYRAGLYSGRNVNLYSPLRGTARLQYNFLDKEKGFFYTGTTLGKGRLFSIGGGLDLQGSYRGLAADAIVDLPLGDPGSVTVSASAALFDGGGSDDDSTAFTGLVPRQTILFLEAGYFFKDIHLQPYIKFESQKVHATVLKQVGATAATLDMKNTLRSGNRFGVGFNYFISGHNASIKFVYEWVSRYRTSTVPGVTESAVNGEATLQAQFFTF